MPENRRAARSVCCPPRTTWASSASRPPAHRLAATRWISRLLVARSWEPPADEWPVSPRGIRVVKDASSSSGVHDQRSTGKLANHAPLHFHGDDGGVARIDEGGEIDGHGGMAT